MVEGTVGTLQTAINKAYEAACPAKQRKCSKKVTWWNKELGQLRTRSRKLLNRALKTGIDSDWEAHKATQETYKKKIKKSKEEGWRDFCSKTEDLSLVARLRKVFTSGPPIKLDGLTLPHGRTAENQTEIPTHMLETHFPGSLPAGGGLPIRAGPTRAGHETMDWKTAAEIEGGKDLAIRLSIIFRSCLAMRYVSTAWRDVKPSPGDTISLTSFLLKTLERLVDRYIRDGALVERPIAHTQHAYQAGKSTETALHSLIRELEGPLSPKGAAALCVFMDVEGAFDNTSSNAICEAASRFKINSMVVEWIRNMLQTRTVTASLGGSEVRAQVDRGCPQGGVLCPLLTDQTGPEGYSYILGLLKDDRPDIGAEAENGEVDLHGNLTSTDHIRCRDMVACYGQGQQPKGSGKGLQTSDLGDNGCHENHPYTHHGGSP
ncbi:uncharacterized protein LOC125502066 [Athalia rosae]|uniref:uncharacterized protein LOC125502066 n=1 Tax=Athalia rosae TaxID=37344 RepID=UPI0020339D96|nr:uncharacterized protein LOC125502066 [Athalia rosae]